MTPPLSWLVQTAAQPGSHISFHSSCLASVATGTAVLLTAGELGPYAPMLLALGFYAIFFGLCAEAVFLTRLGIAALAGRWLRTRGVCSARRSDQRVAA
jgi:hypothetical protein